MPKVITSIRVHEVSICPSENGPIYGIGGTCKFAEEEDPTMADVLKIPPALMPAIEKLHADLGAVLEDYENEIVSAEGLYDFMVALQVELNSIIFND